MLDLAQLLRVPQVDTGLRFDISPNGERIAFAWNRSGQWEIYESSIDSPSPALLSANINGSKFGPQYAPNGTKLVYALDLDGSESFHVVLHDLQTNDITDLTPDITYAHQPNIAWSPDGSQLAILADVSGQFALYLLSLDKKETRLLFDIQRPCWDVRWSPNGQWIAVQAETHASDYGIFVMNVESGEWRQVQESFPSPSALSQRERGLNAQQPAWSPNGKKLAFSAELGEWHEIGIYNVEADSIQWLTQSSGDDTSPCWSADGERIGWVHAEGATTSLKIKERSGEIKEARVGVGLHTSPQFTSNDEVIFLFESPRQPPDLWKLNRDGSFTQLTNSLPDELRNANFVIPEEIECESDDGAKVPSLLYRGDGGKAVVDIHGGPNWNVQFLWDPFISHLASCGWSVIVPNYRGSTGYGKHWQNASRFDMGGVDTRDCVASANYLLEHQLATHIAVTGRSHGGYLTMTCLTMYPEVWAGGSAVVPFMNWFKSHDDSREDLQHWNIENMGDPKENYERWYNASPYFFLDRVNAPVQLVCGGNDPRCPASDSIDARDKLVELNKTVELLIYEDEGHSFMKIENIIDAETRRVQFLMSVLEVNK